MISSCPNYLYVDVGDGEDLSRHQQEVTGGQLVDIMMSLVPGTVDLNVASECRLCCPPPLYVQRKCPPRTAAEGSVCCFVLLNRYWGIVMYGLEASS